MSAVRKTPVRKPPVVAKLKLANAGTVKGKASNANTEKPATRKTAVKLAAKPAVRAVVKPVVKPVVKKVSATVAGKTMLPNTPEAKKTDATKRKRLSKVFSRPLDKKIKKSKLVRERFTLPEVEYEQLVSLKKRLSDQGLSVKKSELVRAGLLLLLTLDDGVLKRVLSEVPAVK